jgi:hypothetical protein
MQEMGKWGRGEKFLHFPREKEREREREREKERERERDPRA